MHIEAASRSATATKAIAMPSILKRAPESREKRAS
jgi:hypothetical protein